MTLNKLLGILVSIGSAVWLIILASLLWAFGRMS